MPSITARGGSAPKPPVQLRLHAISLSILAASGFLSAQKSQAQGADAPTVLPAITVTAQKREERIDQVPVSVDVLTGDELERSGVTELRQLGSLVPNLTITDYGSRAYRSHVAVRGLANSPATLDSLASLYVDGVPDRKSVV